MLFFFKNICVCQKNVVPLHPLLTKSRESVAQQVEHIPFKDGVLGSSPSWFTESSSLAALFVFCVSAVLVIIKRYLLFYLARQSLSLVLDH